MSHLPGGPGGALVHVRESPDAVLLLLGPDDFGLVNPSLTPGWHLVLRGSRRCSGAAAHKNDHVAPTWGVIFSVILSVTTPRGGTDGRRRTVRRLGDHLYHGGILGRIQRGVVRRAAELWTSRK